MLPTQRFCRLELDVQTESVNTNWQHWRYRLASGLYRSGMLAAFRAVSRHYELSCDSDNQGRLRAVRKPKYVILGYHNVGTTGLPLYCRLPQRVFAEQMKFIKAKYRVISLGQMLDELRTPRQHGQSIVVTFDDGYLGTYTEAFPVLKHYAIPATVYLTAELIDSGATSWYDRIFLQFQRATSDMVMPAETSYHLNGLSSRVDAASAAVLYLRSLPDEARRQWCEALDKQIALPAQETGSAMMTWEHAREMFQAGISFGCHTMTHPVLSRVSPEEWNRQIADSKALIEARLGCEVRDFAFPFGKPKDCGAIAAEKLSRLGLRSAMTTIIGINQPGTDCFRLRRMVQGEESSLAMFAYRLQRLFFHPVDEELNGNMSPAARAAS